MPTTFHGHEVDTFLPDSTTVELPTDVERVRADEHGVTLWCSTLRYTTALQDYYGTVVETVQATPEPGAGAVLRLDRCAEGIVRLRLRPGDAVEERSSPMLVAVPRDPVPVVVDEADEDTVVVRIGDLTVVIDRRPFRLTLLDAAGDIVCRTRPTDLPAFRGLDPPWDTPEVRWIFHHRFGYPAGWRADRRQAFLTFDLAHDERVYGFGESYGDVDKRGTRQRLWVQEAFTNGAAASYKRVPFYSTSRGYGAFVHSSNAMTFHVGDLDHTALSVIVDDTDELDVFLLVGPTAKEILPRYTRLTGAPAVPPIWSFGLWMSRISYRTQQEVEQVASDLRVHRIPCDVIHIDTGWFETDYVCDLEFGSQFPDPAAMIRRLSDQGFKVSLWQWPLVNVESPLFAEAFIGDHLVKRSSGHVYLLPGGLSQDAGLIDYSRPETVAWISEKFQQLFDIGVAAIKVDYGEGAPPDGVYATVAGHEMHNLYPLLYQRAIYEATVAARGEDEAMIWARAGWAGCQRFPVHWSGDGIARFEDLACVLRSMLSMGLSGFPFYSHDIGGFEGTPSSELYVRWAQLGLFSSHARAHGSPPREPWEYGEQAEAAFRELAELRYRLLPYLWTESVVAAAASLPLARPLWLEHPRDPVAATIEDQYLLGRDLLVAPILDERDERRVYLPAGHWVDFFTDEVHEGGTFVAAHAPLERFPLFVRGDAVVPFGRPAQHSGESGLDELTLTVWAPREGGDVEVQWPGAAPVTAMVTIADEEVQVDVRSEGGLEVQLRGSTATALAGAPVDAAALQRWRFRSHG